MHESIGITGCERQCFRPATKTLGWIGQGPNLYALKVWAAPKPPRTRANTSLMAKSGICARSCATRCRSLQQCYLISIRITAHRWMRIWAPCLRRVGAQAIIDHLKGNPKTAPLMEKTKDAPYMPSNGNG